MMDNNSIKAANRRFVEEMSARKANADTQFFWTQVHKNRHNPNGRILNRMSKSREQSELFESGSQLEKGVIEDLIPVERSGPFAEEIQPLNHFSELASQIPPFVRRNIDLMKYQLPTPIQKHAVPFGLRGLDLMCCAQTVSEVSFNNGVVYRHFFRVLAKHLLFCCQSSIFFVVQSFP